MSREYNCLKQLNLGVYRYTVQKKILKPSVVMWVLIFTNFFQATFLRPSADDYAALGRAAGNCGTWLNFARNQWESSFGFSLMARGTFCWDYSKFQYIYNLMTASHVLTSLVILSLIVWLIADKAISKSQVISISSIMNLFLFFPVSKSTQPIRQYLGPSWSSEWLQHSFAFEMLVLAAILVIKYEPLTSSRRNGMATFAAVSFCMTYSNLSFAYSLPVVILLVYKLFKNANKLHVRAISIPLLLLVISLGLAFMNFQSLNRIGIAEEAQVDNSKLLRIIPLLYFSIRETLLVPLIFIIFMYCLGRFFPKSSRLDPNLYFLLLLFFWIKLVLLFAEISTYYAIWHHTPIQILVYIICFDLGRRKGPINQRSRAKIGSLAAVIALGQFLSGSQLAAYANHWDSAMEDNFYNEQYLRFPQNLGIRTDRYWINYMSNHHKMLMVVKVTEAEVQDLAPIYRVFNAHLWATDSLVSVMLDKIEAKDIVTSWLI